MDDRSNNSAEQPPPPDSIGPGARDLSPVTRPIGWRELLIGALVDAVSLELVHYLVESVVG